MVGYIYIILNKINNKRYVGSFTNFNKRKNSHLSYLRNNKHHSDHLQKAFNKYGETEFIFISEKYEIFDVKELIKIEQENINKYKTYDGKYGYNIKPAIYGGKRRPVKESTKIKLRLANLGKKHSDETKLKQSIAKMGKMNGIKNPMYGKSGELSPNFGKKMNRDFCLEISKRQLGVNNPSSKLTEKDVIEIRKINNLSHEKISKLYGVSRRCIGKIINRETWKEI